MGFRYSFPQFAINQSLGGSFDLPANPGIEIAALGIIACQVVWSGGAAPTGTLSLQISNDGINWVALPGASQAISATPGNIFLTPTASFVGARYVRLDYAFTSGSGTITYAILGAKAA